jgi:hypothetical protein
LRSMRHLVRIASDLALAVSGGKHFEVPRQMRFLRDRRRGRIVPTRPVGGWRG